MMVLGLAISLSADEPRLEQSKRRLDINKLHGKSAPKLILTQWLNTKAGKAPDVKGKIVILDFWATWCGPCIASIPKTNKLRKKYADKGVVIIGICASRGGEKMKRTSEQHGIEYPVALDEEGKTISAYAVNSYPDYYIIDREGKLRWGDIANADVEKAVDHLLAEK
tara:strand:+ start:92 stop:592 length:501 start_codon:yes stop_codon:yes gene_type:complete